MHDHETFRLAHLGEGGALDRAWIEHGSVERVPCEIADERLMAMNMPREHGREVARNVADANDVACRREDEVGRTDGGALETVVKAKQANARRLVTPARFLEAFREVRRNIAPLVWEARECDGAASRRRDERACTIEHVYATMRREASVWQARPLVVPRHDKHRHATIGNSP